MPPLRNEPSSSGLRAFDPSLLDGAVLADLEHSLDNSRDLIAGSVVTQTNITSRVVADGGSGQGRQTDPVTMLPTSLAGVRDVERLLTVAQTSGGGLAAVTISMFDLVDIEARHGRRSRDELVVRVVARARRLIRSGDVMIRTSANELTLLASVADRREAEFLRSRIAEVLVAPHLVGTAAISCRVDVAVVTSDQVSSLDSLLAGLGGLEVRQPASTRSTVVNGVEPDLQPAGQPVHDAPTTVNPDVPTVVLRLRDGRLLTANAAARALFGASLEGRQRLHTQDASDAMDVRHTIEALVSSGAGDIDSYRARRTLRTAGGPVELATSVRRLDIGLGELAVVQALPTGQMEAVGSGGADPFATAFVAGVIDTAGAVRTTSTATSPMESELIGGLGETLRLAAHPDDADSVDIMLRSLAATGSATGSFRVAHSTQGWVECRCQVFTTERTATVDAGAEQPVVALGVHVFVLSTDAISHSMVARLAQLERQLQRIGAEVHAADLERAVSPPADLNGVLNSLGLTARQRDIVERLARGQRVPSIAAALFVSRSTVRNHLAQAFKTVGVHSQEDLLIALRGAEAASPHRPCASRSETASTLGTPLRPMLAQSER